MNITKHGVLSIDGVTRSVVIRNIERGYDGNLIVTLEACGHITDELHAPVRELIKALDRNRSSQIEQVIFNAPATIVKWSDGTKTVVKCQPGDVYSEETGLALCIAKKYLGNKSNFNEEFKKWIPTERKFRIVKTGFGCLGAEGLIGCKTRKESTDGLLSTDAGYNVETESGQVWRINLDAKIEYLK